MIEEYKVWSFGSHGPNSAECETLTNALNAYLAKGWYVVGVASSYIVLAKHRKPGRPTKS